MVPESFAFCWWAKTKLILLTTAWNLHIPIHHREINIPRKQITIDQIPYCYYFQDWQYNCLVEKRFAHFNHQFAHLYFVIKIYCWQLTLFAVLQKYMFYKKRSFDMEIFLAPHKASKDCKNSNKKNVKFQFTKM